MDGDKVNREKKRLAEERQLELERQKQAARKRLEEGFTFDSELEFTDDWILNALNFIHVVYLYDWV